MSDTLPSRLIALAEAAPEREALRIYYSDSPELVLSRRALVEAAARAARDLRELGARPGDLVVIVQQDSFLLAATFFGAAMLGAIPSILPFATEKLHPERYGDSMRALLALSTPPILAIEPALQTQVEALLPAEAQAYRPALYLAEGEALLSGPVNIPAPPTDAEVVALLQHSSGTTGLQKGVALAHRAIFQQLQAYSVALDFTADDVIVSWLPLYHDMGLIAGFLMPLLTGARLVIQSPFDWIRAPHTLFHAITQHRGTFCWLPNFAYNHCAQKIRAQDLAGIDLTSIRAFVNCSEPVYASSHQQFAERFAPYGLRPNALSVSYAMAETVFAVTQTPPGQAAASLWVDGQSLSQGEVKVIPSAAPFARELVSCGPPIQGMEVRILDEAQQPLAGGRSGQIALRAPYMLTGYHLRPDATEAAFDHGWYLTGDIGFLHEGEVFVLGRQKDLIIIGGKNIHPTDIESLVNSVEGIYPGRAVAFGVADEQRGTEELGIIAEIKEEGNDVKQVAAAIRRLVSSHSDVTARYVELVPRGWLIKTSSGKIARAANRDKWLNEKRPG